MSSFIGIRDVIETQGLFCTLFTSYSLWVLLVCLDQELIVPTPKFSEGPIAVAQYGAFKISLTLPNDLVFLHLLANIGDYRLSHAFTEGFSSSLGLDERIHGMTNFSLYWRDVGE